MKILVVDDSRSVRGLVREILTSYEIVETEDAKFAMEILKKDKAIQLVLLDWEMPGMSGPELLKLLRSNQIEVPVIMMTSRNSKKDILTMIELGAKEYIMKPFTRDILLEKIDFVMAQSVEHVS